MGKVALPRAASGKVYHGADLAKIGMPVGGICAGQLYLAGAQALALGPLQHTDWHRGGALCKPLEPTFDRWSKVSHWRNR